jgi:hypothetical protein
METEDNEETVCEAGAAMRMAQVTKNTPAGLKNEIAKLKHDIIKHRVNDCLVMTGIQVELDRFWTTRKEDIIIVNSLTSQIPMPAGIEERKKSLRTPVQISVRTFVLFVIDL